MYLHMHTMHARNDEEEEAQLRQALLKSNERCERGQGVVDTIKPSASAEAEDSCATRS